jgi:hypothetical protein
LECSAIEEEEEEEEGGGGGGEEEDWSQAVSYTIRQQVSLFKKGQSCPFPQQEGLQRKWRYISTHSYLLH